MNSKKIIKILDECINDIYNNNCSSEYVNFGFNYSDSVTKILNVLGIEKFREIYINAYNDYDINRIKKLDQQPNLNNFELTDCIVYLNWLWHVEGTGLASGIIKNRIENGKYLKVLLRFKTIMETK